MKKWVLITSARPVRGCAADAVPDQIAPNNLLNYTLEPRLPLLLHPRTLRL